MPLGIMLGMSYSTTREPKIKGEQELRVKILDLYKSELNNKELANTLGIGKTKLLAIMRRMGVERPKRHSKLVGVPETLVTAMLDEYVKFPEKPLDQIAEKFEVSVKTLCKYVNERGVPRRKNYKFKGNQNAKGAPKGYVHQQRSWMSYEMRTYAE
jgi:hypothetical protein